MSGVGGGLYFVYVRDRFSIQGCGKGGTCVVGGYLWSVAGGGGLSSKLINSSRYSKSKRAAR